MYNKLQIYTLQARVRFQSICDYLNESDRFLSLFLSFRLHFWFDVRTLHTDN